MVININIYICGTELQQIYDTEDVRKFSAMRWKETFKVTIMIEPIKLCNLGVYNGAQVPVELSAYSLKLFNVLFYELVSFVQTSWCVD